MIELFSFDFTLCKYTWGLNNGFKTYSVRQLCTGKDEVFNILETHFYTGPFIQGEGVSQKYGYTRLSF